MGITNWLKRFTRERQESPIEESDSDTSDPFDPFPEPVEIEIKDVIDLHTIPPRDVQAVVQEYLHQAYAKGFGSVRIIHGKGIGVQREMVRSILARTTFVLDWTDAPPHAGGLGATIVRLRGSPKTN
jgi:dsDNA-specific endonuclease/ATPase MutS2